MGQGHFGLVFCVACWIMLLSDILMEDHISIPGKTVCAKSNEKSCRRLVNLTGNGLGQNIMFEIHIYSNKLF